MIFVRKMFKHDIERVYEIERLCFRSPWSKSSLQGELKNTVAHYIVLCNDNDTIIAYGGMWLLFDEAHITNIAVHPDYRGNGYSKLLMLHLMREAALFESTQMTLEVRDNNLIAQSLYRSIDFAEQGRRQKYYTDTGEDALLMWNRDIKQTIKDNACLFDKTTLK